MNCLIEGDREIRESRGWIHIAGKRQQPARHKAERYDGVFLYQRDRQVSVPAVCQRPQPDRRQPMGDEHRGTSTSDLQVVTTSQIA